MAFNMSCGCPGSRKGLVFAFGFAGKRTVKPMRGSMGYNAGWQNASGPIAGGLRVRVKDALQQYLFDAYRIKYS